MASFILHCTGIELKTLFDIPGHIRVFCDEVLALLRFQYPFARYSNGYAEIKKMKAKFLASSLLFFQGRIRILIIF